MHRHKNMLFFFLEFFLNRDTEIYIYIYIYVYKCLLEQAGLRPLSRGVPRGARLVPRPDADLAFGHAVANISGRGGMKTALLEVRLVAAFFFSPKFGCETSAVSINFHIHAPAFQGHPKDKSNNEYRKAE